MKKPFKLLESVEQGDVPRGAPTVCEMQQCAGERYRGGTGRILIAQQRNFASWGVYPDGEGSVRELGRKFLNDPEGGH